MRKEIIASWARKGGKEEDYQLRLTLILRLLFDADEHGILPRLSAYKVRLLAGCGQVVAKRILRELHEQGFLRAGTALTEIIPYRRCLEPMGLKARLRDREEGNGGDYFSSEGQPDFGRTGGPRSALQQEG